MTIPPEQADSHGSSSHSAPFADAMGAAPLSGSETVVNPEGRPDYAPPTGPGLAGGPVPPVPDPSAWHRLFPSGGDGEAVQPDPIGVQLDHFVIEEKIRAGGMGAVFRARDVRMNRPVALKVMPPRQTLNPAAVRRFQNEAQAAAQLDHDNIARAYYVGEDKGLHFIAFEFVTGINIAEMIARQGRLPVDDALNYTLQIASALVHTSERGVVHRDIKPSNIIITPKGRAKLVDMGLARNENRDGSADLTVAGTTLGTFDYISPEQAKDPRSVDVRSDIYSLGCTLYHMLTGEAPYPGGTMLQKLLDHQGKDAPDPSLKNPYVSDDLSTVVRKMMASDPRRRYQTADELMRDLMLVAGSMGLRSLNPEGLVWMSSRPLSAPFWERHLPWMSTFTALILLVAAASFLPQRVVPFNNDVPVEPRAAQTDTPNGGGVDTTNPEERVVRQTPEDITPDPTNLAGNSGGQDVATSQPPKITSDPITSTLPRPRGNSATVSPGDRNAPTVASQQMSEVEPFSLGPDEHMYIGPDDTGLIFASLTPPAVPRGSVAPSDGAPVARRPTPPTTITTPGRSTSSPATPAMRSRPFALLGIDGAPARDYPSLEAACTDAVDGSKIELRFNGVRRESKTIRIEDKRITIRAAPGYQPTLELAPGDFKLGDYRNQFFTVAGGALELANIHFTLTVNDDFSTDRWSMFSLEQPESVQMEGVAITVRNQNRRRQLAVFAINSANQFGDMPIIGSTPAKPLQITMTRCIVRGACDLIAVRDQAPVHVSLDGTLLALDGSGTVIRVTGGMYEPDDGAEIDVSFNHTTALLGGGLVTMHSDTVPHKLLPVRITATNNIFSNFERSPLITISGSAPPMDYRNLVSWSGKYNFYDQMSEFLWTESSMSIEGGESLNFAGWENWPTVEELDAFNDKINWLKPWQNMSAATLTAEDVSLDPSQSNRAVRGTFTGKPAGSDAATLPKLSGNDTGLRP